MLVRFRDYLWPYVRQGKAVVAEQDLCSAGIALRTNNFEKVVFILKAVFCSLPRHTITITPPSISYGIIGQQITFNLTVFIGMA